MKTVTDRDWNDWFSAFQAQGYQPLDASDLATECETWSQNNPEMTWQDVFDAVMLAEETK